jgi:predicted RND superfamily exporter protein
VTVIVTVIVVALSLTGIPNIWINSSFLDKFERDSDIVLTDAFINEHFGGTNSVNVSWKVPKKIRLNSRMSSG